MTSITPTADLVACVHCGHLDSGTYCSACGQELADTHKPVLAEVWEHVVVDRMQDLRAFLSTAFMMVARPRRFFRTVMAGPARRAGHEFPQPAADPLRPGLVQTPVKFILAFITNVLASKAAGSAVTEIIPGLGGLGDDVNVEFSLLLLMGYLGLYGLAFHWSTGRRISVEEAAVFNGYLTGANLLVMAVYAVTPKHLDLAAAAEILLVLHVGVVLPYVVLPRLYGFSKRRVLAAQVGAFAGAAVMAFLAVFVVALVQTALGQG
jgi:hypothetical protein